MMGHDFAIRERSEHPRDGEVWMNGTLLQYVMAYRVESDVVQGSNYVTVTFLAKSINRDPLPPVPT